jgi:TRAP transporter TAXI family solute receptor
MMDLQADREITILGLDDDAIEALTGKYPFYTPYTLDENDYSFLAAPVNTVAVRATLVAADSLSQQAAYDIVKAIMENCDKIAVLHAKGMVISAKQAVCGLPLELHPGARRYFLEIGALKEAPSEDPEDIEQEDTQQDIIQN